VKEKPIILLDIAKRAKVRERDSMTRDLKEEKDLQQLPFIKAQSVMRNNDFLKVLLKTRCIVVQCNELIQRLKDLSSRLISCSECRCHEVLSISIKDLMKRIASLKDHF
jgi:hypothetical protein